MSERKRLKLIGKECGIYFKWYMPAFLIKKRLLNMKLIKIGSIDYYIKMIQINCFRGKIIERPMQVTIKIASQKTRDWMIDTLKIIGVGGVEYKVEKLGFFECWFPRYQVDILTYEWITDK